MPGDNFSRRVARAAAVGGGKAYRRETPFGWYVIILAICALGVALVTYSRYERTHATATAATTVPPTKANLWEVGLDVDICNKITQLPATTVAGQGFTTNGHGVVTIEPALATNPAAFSGKNAILNTFLFTNQVSLTSRTLSIPAPTTTTTTTIPKHSSGSTTTTSSASTTSTSTTSTSTTSTSTTAPSTSTPAPSTSSSTSTTTPAKKAKGGGTPTSSSTTSTTTPSHARPLFYANGDRCNGRKAVVQVKVWSSPSAKKGVLVSKPTNLRFRDGQLITIAFVPKGTNIPKPSSAHQISAFLISNPGGIAPNPTGSAIGSAPRAPQPADRRRGASTVPL